MSAKTMRYLKWTMLAFAGIMLGLVPFSGEDAWNRASEATLYLSVAWVYWQAEKQLELYEQLCDALEAVRLEAARKPTLAEVAEGYLKHPDAH